MRVVKRAGEGGDRCKEEEGEVACESGRWIKKSGMKNQQKNNPRGGVRGIYVKTQTVTKFPGRRADKGNQDGDASCPLNILSDGPS